MKYVKITWLTANLEQPQYFYHEGIDSEEMRRIEVFEDGRINKLLYEDLQNTDAVEITDFPSKED